MSIVRIGRHAETTWNAAGRYQGRLESPLSELGQAQARALAQALRGAGIGTILSSPLKRCVSTAAPLSELIGVPIQTDPLLIEIAHGHWEGRYREEIASSEPELYRAWRSDPRKVQFEGGESLLDVARRWQRFAGSFVPTADTLIVTHDVVVRLAILERTGRPIDRYFELRSLNAAYAEFSVEAGRWTLIAESVTGHLHGLAADHERQAL